MKVVQQLEAGLSRRAATSVTLVVLVSAWLMGGATRFDVLAPLGPAIVSLIALALFWISRREAGFSLLEKFAWGGIFIIPALQLVPLPPAIWQSLPTHEYPRQLFALAGIEGWLPLSLTPSRTLSSLFGFLPALAVYLWARRLTDRHEVRLLTAFAVFACASSILGLLQMAGGPGNPLRFYEVTNRDSAVGFFSNANHYGVVMACAIPVIGYLGQRQLAELPRMKPTIIVVTAGAIALVTLGAIASTSRAAYLATLAGLIVVGALYLRGARLRARRKALIGGGALTLLLASLAWLASTGTLSAIAEADRIGERTRLSFVPEFARIASDVAPLGTGLGSFDSVYRGYENAETLSVAYLNNAHNDLAQVAIEAGVPGLAAVAIWLILVVRIFSSAAARTRENRWPDAETFRFIALGFGVAVLLAHSLVDYPLRGASASAVLALFLALAWNMGRERGS